jgi:uncharacterized alkaline shock family protein YloU
MVKISMVMEQAAPVGSVRVANEVIASIAALAAREIDGVAGLDEANARHFGDFLKRLGLEVAEVDVFVSSIAFAS